METENENGNEEPITNKNLFIIGAICCVVNSIIITTIFKLICPSFTLKNSFDLIYIFKFLVINIDTISFTNLILFLYILKNKNIQKPEFLVYGYAIDLIPFLILCIMLIIDKIFAIDLLFIISIFYLLIFSYTIPFWIIFKNTIQNLKNMSIGLLVLGLVIHNISMIIMIQKFSQVIFYLNCVYFAIHIGIIIYLQKKVSDPVNNPTVQPYNIINS